MPTDKSATDKIKWFAWAAFCLALDIFLCIHFKWNAPAWTFVVGFGAYAGILVWFTHEVISDSDSQEAPGICILLVPALIIVAALVTVADTIK